MSLSSYRLVKRKRGSSKRPESIPIAVFNSFVGDRSGSMVTYEGELIQQTKKYIKEIKKNAENTNVSTFLSLTTFDNESTTYINNINVTELDNISDKEYKKWLSPRGGTRLIDTILEVLEKQEKDVTDYYNGLAGNIKNLVKKEDIKKILTIFTDGLDNSSVKQPFELNKKMKLYNGLAIFMGANQDAIQTAKLYGFNPDTCITVGSNSYHAETVFGAALPLIRQVSRGVSSKTVSFTKLERQSSIGYTHISKAKQKLKTNEQKMLSTLNVNVLPVYGSDSDSDIEPSLPSLAPLKLVRTQSLVYKL